MEPSYQEPLSQTSRGGGGGNRRPRQNRGYRGRGARNGLEGGWERNQPQEFQERETPASNGLGSSAPPKLRRNRGQRASNWNNGGQNYPQPAVNEFYAGRPPADAAGYSERDYEANVPINYHQESNGEESRQQARPRGGRQKQNRSRDFNSYQPVRNHNPEADQLHDVPSHHQSSFPYPPTLLQESQSYYHSSNAAPTEYQHFPSEPSAATKPKQSQGPRNGGRTTDYRKSQNVPSSENNPSVRVSPPIPVEPLSSLEHQPYDIAREYSGFFNNGSNRSSSSRGNGNVPQDGRNRRDERSRGGGPPEGRPRRDERQRGAGGYQPAEDRFNRRREDMGHPATNWRSSDSNNRRYQPTAKKVEPVADTATQRERLTSQLTSGTYECMVCCESVKPVQSIWNCSQCFHVFHLGCVKRWSSTSQDEGGEWRCPGCQSINKTLPSAYLCFCSKRKDPEWNRREIPHSCGEVCGKALGDPVENGCSHSCTLLCHPGPCPNCSAQAQRKCGCGKMSQPVKCGSSDAVLCGEVCGKHLSCDLHQCEEFCHGGACMPCPLTVEQQCYCGKTKRQVPCSIDHPSDERFNCEDICDLKLNCGRHRCQQSCHPGPCGSCSLLVETVTTCPCGKVDLKQLYQQKKKLIVPERKVCTDPVPVCGKICGRPLPCGPTENRHLCTVSCHSGSCPSCPQSTLLRCRCGRSEKNVPCKQLVDLVEVLCERRCNKKRQCGRHKCIQVCCIDGDHICPMVCARQLSCGLHRCQALCHAGNCNRCHQVSFDELRCHCGTQVTYPPVPCGTRPPDCNRPCTRVRSCGHPQLHNCHPEANGCPPCTTLGEKWCYGKHEKRKNIPCHLTAVSCGKACGRPLRCGRHTCLVSCHLGPCPTTCSQPCTVARADCGHLCGLNCHDGDCPATPCREKVKVQCQCGQRQGTVSCEENESSYRKMATGLLASKMAQLQSGEASSVDLKDLLGKSAANKTKSLECNDDCALAERNRRLALALQIKNPDPKPGAPRFPDALKDFAKKEQRFAQMVHDKLTDLVQLAKQSLGKMKSRSFSFEPMNRDKRQFIHDYSLFFGCESISYDEEPKRNVVATAYGELSFLPAVGIVEVTRREMGQRKMPGPPRPSGLTVLTSGGSQQLQAPAQQQTSQSQPPVSAWGKSGGAGPFRTLSDVVKSTPSMLVPSSKVMAEPQPLAKTLVSSEPKQSVVDYFDFTS